MDNEGEYISSEIKSFLQTCAILQPKTASYNPFQNGIVERLSHTPGGLI